MYCLSATAEREGVEYIAVIMHGESIDSRNNDAMTLLNYAFANYSLCSLRPEEELPRLPVELGSEGSVGLEYGGSEFALVRKSGVQPEYAWELPESLKAPIYKGDVLGRINVTIGGERAAEIPLVAADDVPRIGFFGILGMLAKSLFAI